MTKIFQFYSIGIMLIIIVPSFAESFTSPCDNSVGSTACKLVWSSNNPNGFKSSNVHSDDDHVQQVFCSPRPEAGLYALNEFSNDNKTLTINYLGLKHTCYTHIDNLINNDYGNVNHGYIEATIMVNASTAEVPDNTGGYYSVLGGEEQIWPAFYLSGANWPTQGEIDVAEGFFHKTATYLHGEDYFTNESSIKGGAIGWLPDGFYDHQYPHIYGLEWQLLGDNQIIFKIYYDNVFQYSSQVHDTNQSPYSQIKKGLQSGTMSVIFDADQGPSNLWEGWSGDIRYSMRVSNVNVYSINF